MRGVCAVCPTSKGNGALMEACCCMMPMVCSTTTTIQHDEPKHLVGDYRGHRSEASPSMAWLEWFLGNAKWSNVGK